MSLWGYHACGERFHTFMRLLMADLTDLPVAVVLNADQQLHSQFARQGASQCLAVRRCTPQCWWCNCCNTQHRCGQHRIL